MCVLLAEYLAVPGATRRGARPPAVRLDGRRRPNCWPRATLLADRRSQPWHAWAGGAPTFDADGDDGASPGSRCWRRWRADPRGVVLADRAFSRNNAAGNAWRNVFDVDVEGQRVDFVLAGRDRLLPDALPRDQGDRLIANLDYLRSGPPAGGS